MTADILILASDPDPEVVSAGRSPRGSRSTASPSRGARRLAAELAVPDAGPRRAVAASRNGRRARPAIREGLTAIGLTDTPILALNTKWAVFARGRRPLGARESSWRPAGQREEGVDEPPSGQNLPLLERLLVISGRGRGRAAAPRAAAERARPDAGPDPYRGPANPGRGRGRGEQAEAGIGRCSTYSAPRRATSTSCPRTTRPARPSRRSTAGVGSWRRRAAEVRRPATEIRAPAQRQRHRRTPEPAACRGPERAEALVIGRWRIAGSSSGRVRRTVPTPRSSTRPRRRPWRG